MKINKLEKFFKNLESVEKILENKEKKVEIGRIILSLQQPFKNVITSICENQIIETEKLLKQLKWKK